jgi:hypothetical protein
MFRVLYGIAQNSVELGEIPCHGIEQNFAEQRDFCCTEIPQIFYSICFSNLVNIFSLFKGPVLRD